MEWVKCECTAVHPDNREGAGLVAIDVHDLLLRIVHLGWNWSKVDVLAAQIPPNAEGERWRNFSAKVATSSGGLLAAVKPDELEACTGRGSHTTASVRCMLHSVLGVHDELCMNGRVSLAKILETRPSMNEPIQKPLPVQRVKWEICVLVPNLMDMLSRSGNTSHSVNRKPTVLQQLMRCHALIVKYPEKSPDAIANMAAIGQELGFESQAKPMIEYLIAHAGGKDGKYLDELVRFEASLQVKRKIKIDDLKRLSEVNLQHQAPRYPNAVFKAMLACPKEFCEQGFSNLFTSMDFDKIKPGGKLFEYAKEAHVFMQKAESFLAAYAFGIDQLQRSKLLDDLEIRLVMHVHAKKMQFACKLQKRARDWGGHVEIGKPDA